MTVDHGRHLRRNGRMMIGAHMSGSSPATSGLSEPGAAPCTREMAENAETLKIMKTVKTVKTAKTSKSARMARQLSHDPAAPPPETLKQGTMPASRGGAETVKRMPGRPCAIAPRMPRISCETLKQRRKTQAGEGVKCFMPISPAGRPETASRRSSAARETVKHPALPKAACRGHETLKRRERRHRAERPRKPID